MANSHIVPYVREQAAEHLDCIAALFKDGAEVTLVVARKGAPEQDFVLTSGSLDEAIAALQRSKGRPDV
jgi:hypothetical protein